MNIDIPDLAAAAPVLPATDAPRRDGVEAALALKVLLAHLANFRQVSFPLTLDFRSFSADETRAAVNAAALAVEADEGGWADGARRRRAAETLARLGAAPADLEPLGRPEEPAQSLGEMVREAQRLDRAAHAYAVSLLVLGRRSVLAQSYLAYLAARLGLTANVVGSLNRRFRG
ncbi:DUF533 domain-containing protein [Aureimonas flava]|uniref:DUF533 domain-containing protein n=1 Tax=Aureimonas flava TaxID=2320271 RepID=A0A3A1WR72_9HYPH|nr:DUF533 domain-containing protein [Aureimonas flava]RIX99638.1 DUF533 domain-containing protein [Aureimonas flava]